MRSEQVLVHSTRSVRKVFESGYIEAGCPGYGHDTAGVYMHLMYPALDPSYMAMRGVMHGYSAESRPVLCIKTDALKDLPFRACRSMSGGCEEGESVSHHGGRLVRLPSLAGLRRHIDGAIKEAKALAASRPARGDPRPLQTAYVDSHEVVVMENVPLRPYLMGVLVRSEKDRARVQGCVSAAGLHVPVVDTTALLRRLRTSRWCATVEALRRMTRG
jgi:hypothetical protein